MPTRVVKLRTTRFAIHAAEEGTTMTPWLLKWGPPILAAITALLEAGHEGNLFRSEVIVLVFAILTAVTAFTAAVTHSPEPTPAAPAQPAAQKK